MIVKPPPSDRLLACSQPDDGNPSPCLEIVWSGGRAAYLVDNEEVPPDVYRDVLATVQLAHLVIVSSAADRAAGYIDWLGNMLDRLARS